MSMVSRRVFLKCIGASSAAAVSAVLLGGCSGENNPSTGSDANNNAGNSGISGNPGNNAQGGNATDSGASDTPSGGGSSEQPVTIGDLGKGQKLRSHIDGQEMQREDRIYRVEDQGVEIVFDACFWFYSKTSQGKVVADDITLLIYVQNNSESIEIPVENVFHKASGESNPLKEFIYDEEKWPSKYMEAYLGSQRLSVYVASLLEEGTGSTLKPGEGMTIHCDCFAPGNWTKGKEAFDVHFTMPYDPQKYVNFIVYPSDVQ